MYEVKSPYLSNVTFTIVYKHNGVFDTLEDVMEIYNNGVGKGLHIAPENQTLLFDKLDLSKKEIKTIIAFIKTLTVTTSIYNKGILSIHFKNVFLQPKRYFMSNTKPVIGISCGDLNGIGIEIIIKTFSDHRILDHCTPVIFASNKAINFYRKSIPEVNFNYQSTNDFSRINTKQVNLFTCWEEEVNINPGQLSNEGGKYAVLSLQTAVAALKQKQIDGLVTAPIHKKNIQTADFNFTGHTPFLKEIFGVNDVVMMLCANNLRVALVTEHVPVKDIAQHITKEIMLSKLNIIHQSLQKDFGIDKPRIAVLGLNPHAGDEGLIGKEEEEIIKPAIREAKNNNLLVVGPYSADAFFARNSYENFDAVLAMYHDQGLIPFKALAIGEGINFTAGLDAVRTSPDHGVAFDIAGKNKADHSSFMCAVFECIDILNRRNGFNDNRKNPLRKMTTAMFANVKDEAIEE